MTIQDWGAVGEIVGGLAVVVTLIYLALQIKQNTRATRLSTSHAVTEEFRGFFELIAANKDLCSLTMRVGNGEQLSGLDKNHYYVFLGNFLRAFENAFVQWKNGALDSGQWDGMKRMYIDNCQLQAVREYWKNRRHWYSDDFQNFMDTVIFPATPRKGVPLPGEHPQELGV
jgi:hypothetical protein